MAKVLGDTLDSATEKFLLNDKSPSRNVKEIDTRGSHFFLAKYWAEALAKQDNSAELKAIFSKVSAQIKEKESQIFSELINAQGSKQEIGGYYKPDPILVEKAMRPSTTLNEILKAI